MGVDFVGHGELSLTWPQWRGCFALARAFGWAPAGTLAPHDYRRPELWDGDYFSNDVQVVADADAQAMGTALDRALAALTDHRALTDAQAKAWGCDAIGARMVCRLADYAEAGGFAIS